MIEKLSLKSRLLLIAALPIAIMLALGLTGASQKYAGYQASLRTEALVTLVVELGETAHELQKERGMSSGFLREALNKSPDLR